MACIRSSDTSHLCYYINSRFSSYSDSNGNISALTAGQCGVQFFSCSLFFFSSECFQLFVLSLFVEFIEEHGYCLKKQADCSQSGEHKEYDIQIGQGVNGDSGLPSDLSFDITIKNLNKSACISLSEMPLEKQDKLILMKITII